MDEYDVFSLPNGSITDIAGVIMHVGPIDHDTYFPLGMRELAVVDSNDRTVFLRFLDELADSHREQLFFGERHYSFLMATFMEVDQASRSLLSTTATTITFHRCLPCHQFDMLEGVRKRIHNDSAYGEAVKNVVLLRRDAQNPANEYNTVHLPAEASSIKYMYNYLKRSTPGTSPDKVDKYNEVD
ncbi:uncharacterized protein [Lolium perenne]|uniref:uncharacterized protein n=1 Tax=Lolium perenne TaxID=4522 RepID=UPI0021F521F1|nr:uncharacterized protein LOC127324055 [Lolium perenne]